MLGLTRFCRLDLASHFISIAKTASKKIGALIHFFRLRFLSVSINVPYAYIWSTVVMYGLVPLVVTWNC